jgi:hypothetical protein
MALISHWSRATSVLLRYSNRTVSRSGRFLAWLAFGGCLVYLIACNFYHTVQEPLWSYLQDYTETYEYEAYHWTTFQAEYQRRFGRAPPSSLQQWHRYAKYHGCSCSDTNENYDVLNRDLETFRDQTKSMGRLFLYSQVLESGAKQTNNYVVVEIKDHGFQAIVQNHTFGKGFAVIERNLRWMLAPVMRHVPPIKTVLFFDLHDHPSKQSTADSLPLFSTCRMSYWTDNQPPPSQEHLQELLKGGEGEVLYSYHQATKQVNPIHPDFSSYDSRTLLMPYYYALDVDMLSPGPIFSERKDAIVWRGSTTGYDWGISPRFQLVNEFGGGRPYRLKPPAAPVEMDFAFTRIVQKHSINHTLPPGNRMAPLMPDHKTQQYKYILDVDGNGE